MPKPAHAKNAIHYVYVVSTGQKYKTWEEAAAVLKSLPAGGRKFDALEELGDVDDLYGLSYDDTKVLKKLIEKSLQEDYWFLYGVLS